MLSTTSAKVVLALLVFAAVVELSGVHFHLSAAVAGAVQHLLAGVQ